MQGGIRHGAENCLQIPIRLGTGMSEPLMVAHGKLGTTTFSEFGVNQLHSIIATT